MIGDLDDLLVPSVRSSAPARTVSDPEVAEAATALVASMLTSMRDRGDAEGREPLAGR